MGFHLNPWRKPLKQKSKMRFTFTKLTLPNLTNLTKLERSLGNDDDELFLWYGWPTKGSRPYFQPEPLSEILNIANLWHTASRTWTCAEPEFSLCWMKLCSSDNHYRAANKTKTICCSLWLLCRTLSISCFLVLAT